MVTKLQCKISEFTNILHIADVHIRLTKRHDEYLEVFGRLYKAIEKTPSTTLIAVLGDLFHSKSDLSPECVKIASDFLQNLARLRPTVLIAGNHDATLANKNRLDSLTPIVDPIKNENLFYLKDSGIYIIGDIMFNNFSVFDEHEQEKYVKYADIPKNCLNETRHRIALFHGAINDAVNDIGYKISNKSIQNQMFDNHQIVLVGDIHKHQILQQYDEDQNKPVIVYCGSLVQQNHGEDLKGHGFVYWDLKTKAFKHFEIANDYGFYTIEVNKGKLKTDIQNIPKKARLRIKCFESVTTEVKSVLAEINKVSNVTEVSYVRVDDASASSKNIINNTNLNINNIVDVDYQNKLISEYIKNKVKIDDDDLIQRVCVINKELNASLQKEHVVRNIRWKPKKFEFDNMFSYGEDNVIDFSKMKDVVGLFASNASGKSSILSALSFCIFDKCDRAFKASHVLNTQKMSFKCKFNFEIDKVDYYIERNGVSDKKGNVKVDVKFWKEEAGKVTELNGEARRSTNDIIRDYVGTYDDFILTVLSVQNNRAGSFIDMGQTERKDLLSQFMGLNIFDTLYNLATEKTKEINILVKNFKNNDYTQKLVSLNNIIEVSSSMMTSERNLLEQLNLDREHQNNNLLEETKKLININSEFTDIVILTNKEISYNNNIATLSSELLTNQSQQQLNENELITVSGSVSSFEQHNVEVKYKEYTQLQKQYQNKKNELDHIKIVVANKLEKLKTLEQHKYDPNCEYCINNAFVKDAIKTKEEIDKDKSEAFVLFESYVQLKNQINSYSTIESDYESYKKLLTQKSNLENKINKINNSVLSIENKIASDKNKLESVIQQIADFNKQKDVIESNTQIKIVIENIRNQIKLTDQKIKQKNNEIITLNSNYNSSSEQKKNIEKIIEDTKKMESQSEAYQLYVSSIGLDGIPYELISQAIPAIEKEVNDILNQMVEFTISISTDGKNVSTFINYEDKKWPLELSSGMERFISSLAIRVALINISNLPRPNFIAIDEGWGSLDADNLATTSTLFTFLKTNFDFVWIVSHLDSMRDMVDSHVEIKKENGFSKVSFI